MALGTRIQGGRQQQRLHFYIFNLIYTYDPPSMRRNNLQHEKVKIEVRKVATLA